MNNSDINEIDGEGELQLAIAKIDEIIRDYQPIDLFGALKIQALGKCCLAEAEVSNE